MQEEVLALLIPIIAIFMALLIPIVYAIVDYRRRRDIVEAHHKERMAAIDRGMEIPPLPNSFYAAYNSGKKPKTLLWGMIWLFLGIGLLVALNAVSGRDVALFALMPIGIGLAMLIYYFVEGRKEASQPVETTEATPVSGT